MDKIKQSLDGSNEEAQKKLDALIKDLGIEDKDIDHKIIYEDD